MNGLSNIKISQLANTTCNLGEGILFSKDYLVLAWVDILKKYIFTHNLKTKITKAYKTKYHPSCIIKIDNTKFTYLDSEGISILNTFDNSCSQLKEVPDLSNNKDIRANDGVIVGEKIFFGSMYYDPSKKKKGYVYLYENKKLIRLDEVIIPNSFIPFNKKIIISDSFKKVIYQYDLSSHNKKVWLDLSSENHTPDGGCLTPDNTILLCMWGSGCINEYSLRGDLLNSFEVPAKNPTNCCFIENNKIAVTSAAIECERNDLKKWPLSGKTMIIEFRNDKKNN